MSGVGTGSSVLGPGVVRSTDGSDERRSAGRQHWSRNGHVAPPVATDSAGKREGDQGTTHGGTNQCCLRRSPGAQARGGGGRVRSAAHYTYPVVTEDRAVQSAPRPGARARPGATAGLRWRAPVQPRRAQTFACPASWSAAAQCADGRARDGAWAAAAARRQSGPRRSPPGSPAGEQGTGRPRSPPADSACAASAAGGSRGAICVR